MIISIIIIVIILFVNREQELAALRERLTSDEFELIVIYGRRRVGKTRLILESVKDIDSIEEMTPARSRVNNKQALRIRSHGNVIMLDFPGYDLGRMIKSINETLEVIKNVKDYRLPAVRGHRS